MNNWSDGGSEWGGNFSQVGRNPRRKEYEDSKAEGKQVRSALSEPERKPDAIDALIAGGALDRTSDVLTTKRTRDRENRLRYEAGIQAIEIAKHLNQDNDYGEATPAERAAMDAYLAEEDGPEDDRESGFAWR